MPTTYLTIIDLLAASSVFMTFTWYVHPRNLANRPWWITPLLLFRAERGW